MRLAVLLATLQCLFVYIGLCYQQQQQQTFKAPFDSGNNSKSDQTLTLKSIYHHASVSGPIPGLFRRLNVPSLHTASKEEDTFQVRSVIGTSLTAGDPSRMYELYKYNSAQGERLSGNAAKSMGFLNIQWKKDLMLMPDIRHRPSVLAFAKMTNNAYYEKCNETGWYDLGTPWNLNNSFGWESDGIRGHVFGNHDNSLLVISFKGTSAGLWSGGPTGEKDKINDNLLFSCCCARISRAWTPVCDCYHENDYLCESSCLERNIAKKEFYYDHAMEIYKDVSDRFPHATIWLTGHSLGGVLASLVGQTFLVPTVTFETPPDRLASRRLHLPHGPGVELPLWHFGHTADPIFIGACIGPSSSCWYGGFAMESKCHTGKLCAWDTVNDKGWRVDIRSHRIQDVIEYILKEEHEEEFPLPECRPESDACDECVMWEFVDERDGPHSSSSSTTMTSTSTSTAIPEPPGDPWDMYIPHNT